MTNAVVVAHVKDLVKLVAPQAPFQPTIAELWRSKNLPEVWSTVEFSDAANQRLTIGKRAIWREFSSFTVVIVAKAGFGVNAVLDIGQRVSDSLQGHQSQLVEVTPGFVRGSFRIDSAGAPNPEDFEDGNWLITNVVCVYTYDSVRGAVQP